MDPSHNSLNAHYGFFSGLASQQRGRRTKKKSEQMPQMPEPAATDSVQAPISSDLPVMVPLSIAEIRRLFFCLVGQRSLPFAHRLAWSFWRRAHQALARLCHYRYRSDLASYLQL